MRLYKKKATRSNCMIKVDLRKAFDSISWDFLSVMLDYLNFPPIFEKWIMVYVSTPSYSILLNGGLHGFIIDEKGLRQGDPLSPLLFTICMYLSRLLVQVSDK